MDLETLGKAFQNHLTQLSGLQSKYGHLSAYQYFEIEKRALISQYDAMVKTIIETKK
jgi:hypothetical protein